MRNLLQIRTPSGDTPHASTCVEFHTLECSYILTASKFTCNKFGIAEFLAHHYCTFELPMSAHALDVGAGVGPLALFLAESHSQSVTAVEINSVAYQDLQKNIATHSSPEKIIAVNEDFAAWSTHAQHLKYNLIVSNPPIPATLQYDASSFCNTVMDQKTYTFLTNNWHDQGGRDLLDYILVFAGKALAPNGHIILACCDIEIDASRYIEKKVEQSPYTFQKRIDGYITPESIGVENIIHKDINAHVFLLKHE